MTHLLKPNDNGLASLDEVKAWMEAQTSAQETPRKPERKRKNRSLEGFFLKQHAEAEHDYDGWQEALEGTYELIATLPEIYRGLKESRAFAEQLRKDLLYSAIITGTTCELSEDVDWSPRFSHRQESSFSYDHFDQYFDPFSAEYFFSSMLGTIDSPSDMKKTFTHLANEITTSPIHSRPWPSDSKYGVFPVCLTLNDLIEDSVLFISINEPRGRIYTIKEDKSGKRP